jgi:hypothetical protein
MVRLVREKLGKDIWQGEDRQGKARQVWPKKGDAWQG